MVEKLFSVNCAPTYNTYTELFMKINICKLVFMMKSFLFHRNQEFWEKLILLYMNIGF